MSDLIGKLDRALEQTENYERWVDGTNDQQLTAESFKALLPLITKLAGAFERKDIPTLTSLLGLPPNASTDSIQQTYNQKIAEPLQAFAEKEKSVFGWQAERLLKGLKERAKPAQLLSFDGDNSKFDHGDSRRSQQVRFVGDLASLARTDHLLSLLPKQTSGFSIHTPPTKTQTTGAISDSESLLQNIDPAGFKTLSTEKQLDLLQLLDDKIFASTPPHWKLLGGTKRQRPNIKITMSRLRRLTHSLRNDHYPIDQQATEQFLRRYQIFAGQVGDGKRVELEALGFERIVYGSEAEPKPSMGIKVPEVALDVIKYNLDLPLKSERPEKFSALETFLSDLKNELKILVEDENTAEHQERLAYLLASLSALDLIDGVSAEPQYWASRSDIANLSTLISILSSVLNETNDPVLRKHLAVFNKKLAEAKSVDLKSEILSAVLNPK